MTGLIGHDRGGEVDGRRDALGDRCEQAGRVSGEYGGSDRGASTRSAGVKASPSTSALIWFHSSLRASPSEIVRVCAFRPRLVTTSSNPMTVLREYEDFYNTHWPHGAFSQAAPLRPLPDGITDPDISGSSGGTAQEAPSTNIVWWHRFSAPTTPSWGRDRARHQQVPGTRYFHGCYSLSDDQLRGVTRLRKGGDHTLAALKSIRAARPDGAPIYAIMDNLSANKTPVIRIWAKKHKVKL
jgi:hypothetical protein